VDTSVSLEIGTEPFPGYRLRRFLGRGGFGEVWEAETPEQTRVALKFLPCESRVKTPRESRTLQIVRQLRHPHLVRIRNIWCYPGHLVVAMELADGTLEDLLEVSLAEFGKPVAPEFACPLLAQAAAALDFLNTRQHQVEGQRVAIQHCDVKLSNLLIFGETVKLSDYSLAAVTTSPVRAHDRAGTWAYMAPEVFQGRLSDRTDQYALAVAYCLLRGGRLPFPERPPPESPLVPAAPDLNMLSEGERPIIARALAPVPMARWPSCGELIAELQSGVPRTSQAASEQPDIRAEAIPVGPAASREQRASRRHSSGLGASVRLLGEQDQVFWRAVARDISNHGIGLVSDREFPRGTILVVQLTSPPDRQSRPMYVRVVRAVPQAGGRWLLGCTFARQVSDGEIDTLRRAS
jgi:serine/threonine protein kinase